MVTQLINGKPELGPRSVFHIPGYHLLPTRIPRVLPIAVAKYLPI